MSSLVVEMDLLPSGRLRLSNSCPSSPSLMLRVWSNTPWVAWEDSISLPGGSQALKKGKRVELRVSPLLSHAHGMFGL